MLTNLRFELRRLVLQVIADGEPVPAFVIRQRIAKIDGEEFTLDQVKAAIDELVENEALHRITRHGFTSIAQHVYASCPESAGVAF